MTNLSVCAATEILMFAEQKKLAHWNELHDLIWNTDEAHRHWFLDAFVITPNFFNPDYLDDAYGLFWNERVRDIVQKFMRHHKVEKMLVVGGKNYSLSEL